DVIFAVLFVVLIALILNGLSQRAIKLKLQAAPKSVGGAA
ncbi:MAG: hypothetical protein ACPGUX_03235, partial [Halocynthiibacter sp.]